MRELPFAIDDSESNVFVRWACTEMQKYGLIVTRLLNDLVRRCLRLIDEIGVEDIEFVPLDDLRRGIVRAIQQSTRNATLTKTETYS